MSLHQAVEEVLNDLPWSDHTRFIVGPLASREAVKDLFLSRATIMPSWTVGTFSEFCLDFLKKNGVIFEPVLSSASQCDALMNVAQTELLRNAAADLSRYLRDRAVAVKVARFLTNLDRFYESAESLDATIEYFETKDEQLAKFLRVMQVLWSQGELVPWSDGYYLRLVLETLEARAQVELPQQLWLWGFHEFTPLEERVIEKWVERGVSVNILVPPNVFTDLESRCSAMGARAFALENQTKNIEFWEAHSVWDELAFLRENLKNILDKGTPLSKVAVFVPNNDLYKRLVRDQLHEWNVPLSDPTLSGSWKDKPRWIWWRDYLRVISGGLKVDEVRAWLGPVGERKELLKAAFDSGIHGGAGQWARLAAKLPDARLQLLVEGAQLFAHNMNPQEFSQTIARLIENATKKFADDSTLEVELLADFARHLCDERPYLQNFNARLPRYVALFEEYLESRSRQESLRCAQGLQFLGHGVWLPEPVEHAFILGLNMLARPQPKRELWEWEGLEVRKAWEKVHFSGVSWEQRVQLEQKFLEHALTQHAHCVISSIDHDLSGSPLAKTFFYKQLKNNEEVTRWGGHASVGWTRSLQPQGAHPDSLVRPATPVAHPISVSAFEDYLKCPFIYYGRHVLKVAPEETLGLDPDGKARGIVLHRVLEKFLRAEIQQGPHASVATAKARLKQLVEIELRENALPGMYRHKPLIAKACSVITAVTERWADWEFENRKKHPDLRPYAVEKPIEVELFTGFRLRGKADRIDSDGRHSVIIDYKSGASPFIGSELKQGFGAQLLLYARGVELSDGLEPAAAYYLSLGRKIDSTKGIFLKKHVKRLHTAHPRNSGLTDGEFSELYASVSDAWTGAADRLLKGDFKPNPARGKKECDACHYRKVCGFQQNEEA